MTVQEYVQSLHNYVDDLFYILVVNCGLSPDDAGVLDFKDVLLFQEKHKREKDFQDMFLMQLQGIDPKKTPYYARLLNDDKPKKKVKLPKEEALTYKKLFDKVLRDGR